jgi:hypothetical protein
MTTINTAPPPANWYPDPAGGGQFRYWDGVGWTAHLSPQPVPGGGPPAWNDQNAWGGGAVAHRAAYRTTTASTNGKSTGAIVCGALALFVFPIILGPIALHLASKAKERNESMAGTAKSVAMIGFIGGLIIGFLAFRATY